MVNSRIAIVTTSRAEYGLLRPLILAIKEHRDLELQLIVGGMHLSSEFGMTVSQIEADGFSIAWRLEFLLASDTPSATVKAMALAQLACADAFVHLQPGLVVLLGDRFETFAIAGATVPFKIPVLHLHGGEVTEGAYDESFRHAISKLSHLHAVSNEQHRKRVLQMGENPANVHDVGAIGIDNIVSMPLLDGSALAQSLGWSRLDPFFLVTYHPTTLGAASIDFLDLVCEALLNSGTKALITKANADNGGREINERLDYWASRHPDMFSVHTSLGALRYLSAMRHCVGVVGNSSSGIIEAPSFGVPTLNLGDRQKGRLAAQSVLHFAEEDVADGLLAVLDPQFREFCKTVRNPYGDGRTTPRIVRMIEDFVQSPSVRKPFFDVALNHEL